MKQQWHSGFDDSSGWGRLIDPICLFILCQIAGTLWVITPRKAFAPAVAPNPSVDVHRAEVSGFTAQKSALEKAVKLARKQLGNLSQPVQAEVTEVDRLNAEIRANEQQVKESEEKLGELNRKESNLKAKIEAVPGPDPQIEKGSQQLAPQLAAKQAEVKRLQQALDQANGPLEGAVGSPTQVASNLNYRFVHLIKNRAVPVDDKHYKVDGLRLIPLAPGETVDEIKRPDSDFGSFLQRIDSSKAVLQCLLESDSFPIFRAVRRLAREKGISVSWKPFNAPDGVLHPEQGREKIRVPGK
jgi:hypothetical protein